jgi:HSP20 family protein
MQRTLSTRTPRSLTADLLHEMNRLFDDFRVGMPQSKNAFSSFDPACEIEESENHFFMSVDLPGMKKEDIKIEMHDNVLTLSGERRKEDRHSGTGNAYEYEKSYGFFQRTFTLPSTIDAEKIEASYQNGVLEVLLPKSSQATARNIQIQEGNESLRSKRSLGSTKSSETKVSVTDKSEKVEKPLTDKTNLKPNKEDINATTTH